MEGEVSGEDELLQKLRDSRRRFQRRMQQLIEKYDQPFEDGPVVQMSTLTYETPQGFRIWGGGLVKERNPGQIQGFQAKADGGNNGHLQVTAGGPELASPCTQVEDSKSSDVATTFYEEDIIAGSIMPAVPRSPLKDELRRKYLTQVDVLLREEGCLESLQRAWKQLLPNCFVHTFLDACSSRGAGSGEGRDTCVTPVASLASPTRSAHGNCSVSEESLDGPVQPPSSPRGGSALRPRPASVALVPRSDSISFPGTSGGSFSSSRCSEAEDICNATLSDLYAGMLHSMSRLLGARPCCIISTKTFIGQNWSSRRRHRCKSRMNRTSCRGGGRSRRSPQERRPPASEPGKHTAVLRDCENLLDVSGCKMGFEEGPSFLGVSKPHPRALAPGWKGLQRTPPKLSSLTYLDSNAVYHLDQENRFMTLRWLISPVKITSRPRILQGQGGNRYREIELKFDKLHQEYCSSPQKQPGLTKLPSSSDVDVYRGRPAPPGGPWGLEACRLSSPLLRAKAKRLSEAFENLGQRSIKAGSCPPKSSAFPPLSKTDPTHSPGRSEHTADLVCRGQDLGRLRSVSPSRAISVPRVQPPGWAKDRYDDIKEKFDKLHQKYCPKSPQRTQVPSSPRAAPGEASVGAQYQKEFLGKLDPDAGSHGPQKPSPSPQWNIKSPLGSIAIEAPPSAGFALATRGRHEVPTKRRRLSEPLEGRRWSRPWDFSPVDRTTLRPGEEVGPSQSDWEEKQRKEQHIFQDGREK